MRRYASIDFLRGLAIFIMLVLHMVSEYFDVDGALNNIDKQPLLTLVALIVFQFLGGLAGLFLLVSAMGNAISMYRHLQAGKSVESLVIRQVIGGVLLLVFAMLTESTIGNGGMLGSFFDNLNNIPATNVESILYNGYTFETIHTIAWCVILNGIVQGILSVGGRWKNVRQVILVYAVLAVSVVIATPFVWSALSSIGYPFSNNAATGQPLYKPYFGKSPVGEVILGIFMDPLAAPMEPIFPYLAVSFIGSIMGIVLAQPREAIPRDFPRKMMFVGMILFIVGAAGIFWVTIDALYTGGFPLAAAVYRFLSFHRHWAPDSNPPVTTPLAWFWQFAGLNGFAILATSLIIRVVEFRGIGAEFAKKTTFIRRFGFVAFTIYAFQWVYRFNWWWFGTLFYGTSYKRMDWAGTWALIAISLLSFHVIMRLWEKVKYTGTLEWMIGTIANVLIPARKVEGKGSMKWWQVGQLDVDGAFYHAEWLNVIEKDEQPRESLVDSRLSFKVSLLGLVSFFFLPATFVTFFVSRTAQGAEGINKYNKVAFVASIAGIVVFTAFLIACLLVPASFLVALFS